MSKPSGHRDCRTREFLLALTTDDVRQALEEASGDELAPALHALGVHPARSAGRKAPQLLRTRLRALGHDASHDVACFLTQPAMRVLEELLAEESRDLESELLAGPLDRLRATWPPAMVRLTLETLWYAGELTTGQRDRLLAAVDHGATVGQGATVAQGTAVGPPRTPATPSEPAARASAAPSSEPSAEPEVSAPAAGGLASSALDALVADVVGRARSGSAAVERLHPVRDALEELVAVDPGRTAAWYQYGLVVATAAGVEDASARVPLPGPARLAFFRGCARAFADAGDKAGLLRWVGSDRRSAEALLARPEGAEVGTAVVAAFLDDPRAAAELLALGPVPFEGWDRLLRLVQGQAAGLAAAGAAVEAELLLRAMEEACRRWGLEQEAASMLLERVACRRRRSDFVGAARLLASVDDAYLDAAARAVVACEQALLAAEVPGPEAIRFPGNDAEWARLVERLRPVRRHLANAVEGDADRITPNLLFGMLLYAEGDTSAAAVLSRAYDDLADRPELAVLRREVRFHAALARLRLLEPGTDEAAYRDLAAAVADGYAPAPDDLAAAVVALEAHGSPHAGALLAAALAAAPAAPVLVRLVAQRARTGDPDSGRSAESVAADTQLPLSTRFELLDAALEGAGICHDIAAAERLAGAIDEVLVRAGDAELDGRFADALVRNETLRLALEPATADALRLEVLRRIGRVDEARAIATALFYRAAGGSLRGFDAADLFTLLVELGLPRGELDDLARLLPSPPDGEEPATPLVRPVHVLFVGGNETQDRYRPLIDATLAGRYGGKASVAWFLSGWRSNWQADAARIEAAYAQADAVVLMTFVRTHLGQRIRRSAGERGLPWVACTGHGREAVQRAIERAVAVVGAGGPPRREATASGARQVG